MLLLIKGSQTKKVSGTTGLDYIQKMLAFSTLHILLSQDILWTTQTDAPCIALLGEISFNMHSDCIKIFYILLHLCYGIKEFAAQLVL